MIRTLRFAGCLLTACAGTVAQDQPVAPSPAPPAAGPAENAPAVGEITEELDRKVRAGLEALARLQNQDGSFGGGRMGRNVAVTALGCLAFMADGNLPGRGEYGENVSRGLTYILSNCTESGLIADDAANGPMYGHGFATLFLGELYGMTAGGADTALADRLHEALVKAVRLIEQTQNDQGGWRYNPVPYDADVSVTICQVMALRSARNAGVEVAKEVVDRAVEYVRGCQNPDGGFRYQSDLGASAWPRTAAGVATLYYAGIHQGDDITRGLAYIEAEAMPGRGGSRAHYHYGHYYAVQAMYLTGGERWAAWWPAIRAEMLRDQQPTSGLWRDNSIGDAYATAMSLIVLQMPKRYLPIFQR